MNIRRCPPGSGNNNPGGGFIPAPNLDLAVRNAAGQDVGEGETPVAFTGGDVIANGGQALLIDFTFNRENANAAGATYQVVVDGVPVGTASNAPGVGPSVVTGGASAQVGPGAYTVGVRVTSAFVETISSGQLRVQGKDVT